MITTMQTLELKIPPPLVAILMAGGMWGIALVAPLLQAPPFIRVSTPRSDAGLIVTEYGVADSRGATLAERARRLLAIAHPEQREQLLKPH